MKIHKNILTLLLILLMCSSGFGQVPMTARSIGFADAYAMQARGADMIGWNPANLGLLDNPKFRLHFGIVPLAPFPSIQISNNSISPFWLNDLFFTGKKLDQDAKDELLKYFPNDDGLVKSSNSVFCIFVQTITYCFYYLIFRVFSRFSRAIDFLRFHQ